MLIRFYLLSITAVGLWTLPCVAQTSASTTVDMCGAALHIGMTKTETLDAVGKQCAVKEMNVVGHWCVSGPAACSHIVAFDSDNKLNFVSKDLGSAESTDAANLLADFISAIGTLTDETAAGTVSITTNTMMAKDPTTKRDMVMKDMKVTVGNKSIDLQVNRAVGGGGPAINVVGMAVTEVLSTSHTK